MKCTKRLLLYLFFIQTDDYLKRKLKSQPEQSELIRMHILAEASAEASLQARQLQLKRARLAADLNDEVIAHLSWHLKLLLTVQDSRHTRCSLIYNTTLEQLQLSCSSVPYCRNTFASLITACFYFSFSLSHTEETLYCFEKNSIDSILQHNCSIIYDLLQ
uniref:Phosphatase and actin regulator n=1 Tax=Anabas testudineus TaxID=64144 RepID=A0A7N6A9X0_ANATE